MTNQINNQSIIPSTDVIQLTLTLKMTTAQVVETSVTVNNNSPTCIQDYVRPDDQTQPTFDKILCRIKLPYANEFSRVFPVDKTNNYSEIGLYMATSYVSKLKEENCR